MHITIAGYNKEITSIRQHMLVCTWFASDQSIIKLTQCSHHQVTVTSHQRPWSLVNDPGHWSTTLVKS